MGALPISPLGIFLAVAVAVVAILTQVPPNYFDESAFDSYSAQGASLAGNQKLIEHLDAAHDKHFNLLTSWLARPPGARFDIKPAGKEDGALPTIKLGWCELVCKATDFPVVVASPCAACLVLLSLPAWSHNKEDKRNPQLARLPVYESGFTSLPAIPLLYPRRWATLDFLKGAAGLTDYALTAEAQTLANDNWQGGVNPTNTAWTIEGITRPAVSKTRAAVPPVCIEELGWITPAGAELCPGHKDKHKKEDVDVHFPNLEAVGGQALPLAYGTAEHYRAVSPLLTKDAFDSAKGAATATIDTMQTAYSTVIFFRNVTSKHRLRQLEELYGSSEWEPLGTEAIAAAGDLVEVDLMYMQGVKSTAPPAGGADGGPWWNVAAHALFRVVGGNTRSLDLDDFPGGDKPAKVAKHDVSFEPVAILLSNQPKDPKAKLVYTPAKSESAYILAALALRQAAMQAAIWVGHVFNLHIHSVAVTAALYNTIDPHKNVYFSSHPVRQILDFYADPTYVSEFHASLFASGYTAGPGTAAGVPDLLSVWNAYAKKGIVHNDTSWAGNTVPGQLAASRLSEERFRGSGEEGSFAALPSISMNLALRHKVVGPYAKALVKAAYLSDKAVAADEQLQAFATALTSPHGSNLVRLNDAGGEIKTRSQLSQFIEDFITIILTHGSAHLQDFSMRVLNVALNPPRLGHQVAPNPTGKYTDADFMRWVPTTGTAARQYTFVANFVGTTFLPATQLVASQQLLTGGAPSWADGNPYYTCENAKDVEAAHQRFIYDVSAFLREWPRSHGLRAVATNFQDPTRLPRVINI